MFRHNLRNNCMILKIDKPQRQANSMKFLERVPSGLDLLPASDQWEQHFLLRKAVRQREAGMGIPLLW